MKKILFILVLLQIITTSAFAQDGKPILKSEWCGKITGDQYVTAIENGDPDGIFNCTTTELKKTFKEVLNWNIENKWKDQNLNPIVTDKDLYSSLRACFAGKEDANFKKGERLIGYVASDGTIKFKPFRSNYLGEESYKYSDFDVWSGWCGNPIADLAFSPGVNSSTGTTKKDAVVASANGQPIIINNYVYAGNNNGNNNGGDATALALNQPKEDAVDASAPYVAPPPPPAPRYDPPVVYREEPKIIYTTTSGTPSGGDCPECKKASPWGYVLAAGAGVAAGYLLNAVLGNKSSSSGTIYGPPSGNPVDVNGGTPVGPGGPVDNTGGYPVDITGG